MRHRPTEITFGKYARILHGFFVKNPGQTDSRRSEDRPEVRRSRRGQFGDGWRARERDLPLPKPLEDESVKVPGHQLVQIA